MDVLRPLTPRRILFICAGLCGVLFVVGVISLRMGAYPISVRDIVMTLFNGGERPARTKFRRSSG